MRYRALEKGYANGKIIEPGEEFDFEGPQGTWMERVSSPSQTAAKVESSPALATAPSTNPAHEPVALNDLLALIADDSNHIAAEEFTDKGFLRKSAFEKRLGRSVPQGVFLSYIKHVNEQRQSAN